MITELRPMLPRKNRAYRVFVLFLSFSVAVRSGRAEIPDSKDTTASAASMLSNIEAAAESGNASAQAILGTMYFDGVGVPKDHRKAFKWNERAAAQNRPDALLRMGLAYHQLESSAMGDPPEDGWKAGGYWIKAHAAALPLVDAGDPMAMQVEAELIMWGWTGESRTPHDDQDSLVLMRKAAEGGYARAQAWMGGLTAKNSPDASLRWFFKAAQQGSSSGMAGIGNYYDARGDSENAQLWLTRGAVLGDLAASRLMYQ